MQPEHRRWMYNRNYPNRRGLREEFVQGVDGFIDYTMSLSPFRHEGTIRCPCVNCKCMKFLKPENVKLHLYKKGFEDKYYFWTAHGEIEPSMDVNYQKFTDEEAFQKKSAKVKGVRTSEKGSSLHNEGLVTVRTQGKRLAYTRSVSCDEVLQKTHTKKKKDGKKVWVGVEPQTEQTNNEYKKNLEGYIQNESFGDQDGPSKPSDNADISIKVVGDVHKERAYDVGSECSFTRQLPRLSGASSSSSQSLVNEDELEAAQKQLEAMREQVEMDSLRRQQQKLTKKHEAGRLKFAQFEKLVHKVTEMEQQRRWMYKMITPIVEG
ncbi:uncharacterized protein [Nicotiana tomentosiformis]|uniref:uncharacterized protein isoform X1 n=1 Tax=Nicotiana tomentosiformis TaxID=4098 RepID=UPI00051BC44C|nr:uncharacterized protein LOC104098457 [Nicotiana tomentosiformis]